MSRKQAIYKAILSWALPSLRNSLSQFRRQKPFLILNWKQQKEFRNHYFIAEFVHNIYNLILTESFVEQDVYFLNAQAKLLYQNGQNCQHYSLFVYYIQELFKEVPEHLHHKLTWNGPEGDWSWARPTRGDGTPVDL